MKRKKAPCIHAIEKVNGNLGTALGYKQTRKENTKHPCIIIFVPEKKSPEEVSAKQTVPTIMEHNGKWCFTDVVTGGKVKKSKFINLPTLSDENKLVVDELQLGKSKSGKEIGLIGGIKLAFKYRNNKEGYGTAGIAVRKKTGERELGFLTNRHVTGEKKRDFYHPDCNSSKIGIYEGPNGIEKDIDFDKWYGGIIDEPKGFVVADFAFVKSFDVTGDR